ncbi:MAG: hypothetical protein LBQ12_05675 [Deltaproteobacteria bacterium]|nr:hypothetical protein [Deltaproteobacteria bacterium]
MFEGSKGNDSLRTFSSTSAVYITMTETGANPFNSFENFEYFTAADEA